MKVGDDMRRKSRKIALIENSYVGYVQQFYEFDAIQTYISLFFITIVFMLFRQHLFFVRDYPAVSGMCLIALESIAVLGMLVYSNITFFVPFNRYCWRNVFSSTKRILFTAKYNFPANSILIVSHVINIVFIWLVISLDFRNGRIPADFVGLISKRSIFVLEYVAEAFSFLQNVSVIAYSFISLLSVVLLALISFCFFTPKEKICEFSVSFDKFENYAYVMQSNGKVSTIDTATEELYFLKSFVVVVSETGLVSFVLPEDSVKEIIFSSKDVEVCIAFDKLTNRWKAVNSQTEVAFS